MMRSPLSEGRQVHVDTAILPELGHRVGEADDARDSSDGAAALHHEALAHGRGRVEAFANLEQDRAAHMVRQAYDMLSATQLDVLASDPCLAANWDWP